MNDILNKYIGNQNSENSFFTSGHNFPSQSNFLSELNYNNRIHSNLNKSYFSFIDEHNVSDNKPRNNVNGQNVNTVFSVPADSSHAKTMKTFKSNGNEFKMSKKDFPALPGSSMQNIGSTQSSMADSNEQSTTDIDSGVLNNDNMEQYIHFKTRKFSRSQLNTDFHMNGTAVPPTPGIKIDDDKVTNIPSSMLSDQFGIIGFLVSLKAIQDNPGLVTLVYGDDLTTLGMNMSSPENIYPTFAGPFQNSPLGPHNGDFDIPPEYRIHHKIMNKLAPIKLSKYQEDLLFYLFYTFYGDEKQICAANELRKRGWRYHTVSKVWITPVPGASTLISDSNIKYGTFYVFDPQLWCKVVRELILDE
uniref:CCR4-NOT transcription complex subunit 2 n=2 Tax=Schizaphis graminum TaxID=13262 RepID=A0A2S2NP58_SCHGA